MPERRGYLSEEVRYQYLEAFSAWVKCNTYTSLKVFWREMLETY